MRLFFFFQCQILCKKWIIWPCSFQQEILVTVLLYEDKLQIFLRIWNLFCVKTKSWTLEVKNWMIKEIGWSFSCFYGIQSHRKDWRYQRSELSAPPETVKSSCFTSQLWHLSCEWANYVNKNTADRATFIFIYPAMSTLVSK